MKRKHIIFIAGILLGSGTFVACGSGLEERIEIIIGGQSFRVEVARTAEQKRQGLMDRKSLGARDGMIFVYDTDQHLAFWMKNTTIPLTLAFLSKDGTILQIEELKPLSLKSVVSERAARYGLELPAGVLSELDVGVGDRVILPADFP
ncbi:MAG: DUF192 domain-containing protein [Spirochaetaceae bacterium]|nr:MAG: DUF192 domain-containing protein [Spirochaetaceae bacterium]